MPDNLEINYKDIACYLESSEGQCVLILGPELSVDQDGISYKSYFKRMASKENSGISNYFERDNLFSFENEIAGLEVRRGFRNFYKASSDPGLLEMIARVKFPLIINVCPDVALNNIYTKLGIDFTPAYFSKETLAKFKNIETPTKDKPVIYNIFGTVDMDSTLILVHSNLYETIQCLLPDNSLPENIETYLKQASGFLLLGLKFDSWYYQLICHKLKLKKSDTIPKINLSASLQNDTDSVSIAMRNYFDIGFTGDNPMQAVGKLINQCNNNPQSLRKETELSSYNLFVSYSWKDKETLNEVSRETMVDWAQKYSDLKDIDSLLFNRDKDELSYGDSIDSFMTRIGRGKIVIRIISDKYLKSRFCMTEAIRISKYRDDEQRIFTVIWEDTNLEDELIYRDFWKEKCKGILEDKLDNDDYDYAVEIFRFINRFFKDLKDKVDLRIKKNDFIITENGEINISDARKTDFKQFIDDIIKKIKSN
ncbi:MAG TPA: toll/interleukin-1 receptor domain-containing protein [Saprospiraceae bacterium]|nr:toll/interleukin-1 receptor domain-containing protein [Saprospiraceae bacterium]